MDIKGYRESLGMTQKEFVKQMDLGISVPTYSLIESGVVMPTPEMMYTVVNDRGLSDVEAVLLEALRVATGDHPCTREELNRIAGVGDRTMRQGIAELRKKGYRIIFNEYGYWEAKSPEEYKRWLPIYTSYAKTIYETVAAMNSYTEGQMELCETL